MDKLPTNLDFLLDKEWMQVFFNKEAEKIFKKNAQITLTSVERSKSFAPESYNMFYKITMDGQPLLLRASASTIAEKETAFKVMEHLYSHGLSEAVIRVPKPYYFFREHNLMLYQDAPGLMLSDLIGEDKNAFEEKLYYCGIGLKSIHAVPVPSFSLAQPKWEFNRQKISRCVPQTDALFGSRLTESLCVTQPLKNVFCHGDFQPKNIVAGESLYVIDFNSVTLAAKELDISCFINQLEIMLKRYGDLNDFDLFYKRFLEGYGDFDQKIYDAYSYLWQIDILQALISLLEEDPNADKEQLKSAIDYWIKKF